MFNVTPNRSNRGKLLLSLVFATALLAWPHNMIAITNQKNGAPHIDWLDISYRKAEILGGHASPEEALSLLQQLIDLGQLKTVRRVMEKMPKLPESYRLTLLHTFLALETAAYFSLDETDPQMMQQRVKVQKLLARLGKEKHDNISNLIHYLHLSEQFEVAGAAISFARQLAKIDYDDRSHYHYIAGLWSEKRGQYENAFEYFNLALQEAITSDDKLNSRLSVIRVLLHSEELKRVARELESVLETDGKRPNGFAQYAEYCLHVNRPDLAWRFYGILAKESGTNFESWLEHMVKWAKASKQSLQAAQFLDEIDEHQIPPSDLIALLKSKLMLFHTTGNAAKAYANAKKLVGEKPDDILLLDEAVDIAVSANATSQAGRWNNVLLKRYPNNLKFLARQSDIALAQRKPEEAVIHYRKISQKKPDERTVTRRLAQLEEWAGNPETSFRLWKDLQNQESGLESHLEVYRLGLLLKNPEDVLNALDLIEEKRLLTLEECRVKISMHEYLGTPDIAIEGLEKYLEKNPQMKEVWHELARLQMRSREYLKAIETWERYIPLFGRNSEEAYSRSECYWRMGHKDKALAIMESFTGVWENTESIYQAGLIVEIGWRNNLPELAFQGLDSLVELYNEKYFFLIERILLLQHEAGNTDEAISLASEIRDNTNDARFLSLALNFAVQQQNKVNIRSLLEKMDGSLDDFFLVPEYWLAKANLLLDEGNAEESLTYYKKVMELDPTSLSAKEGILWSLLYCHKNDELSLYLNKWKPQAERHKELWLIFALARHELGQKQHAAEWYERLILHGEKKDIDILSQYAGLLHRSGSKNRALRLQRFIAAKLRQTATDYLQQLEGITEDVQTYVSLIMNFGNSQQKEFWLTKLQQEDIQTMGISTWLEEMIVANYLESQRYDLAQEWLSAPLHSEKKYPAWQRLILAQKNRDTMLLEKIYQEEKDLSMENKFAILIDLDRPQEALKLAEAEIQHNTPLDKQALATALAASVKHYYPHYWYSSHAMVFSDQLDSNNSTLSGAYSFDNIPVSLALKYSHIEFNSPVYSLSDYSSSDDFTLSAFSGSINQGTTITVGFNTNQEDNCTNASLEYYRKINKEILGKLSLSYNTIPKVDSILQIAALQNRISTTVTGTAHHNIYYLIDLWGREYTTRSGNDIFNGIGARGEVGFRQRFGGIDWHAGIQGNVEKNYQRRLPDDLDRFFTESSSVENIIAEQATSLLLGGEIGRGDIREPYPTVGSLRYTASAWFGHVWPKENLVFNFNAGIGSRVMGNDELSLQLYYNQSGNVPGQNDDGGISIQYRYHF